MVVPGLIWMVNVEDGPVQVCPLNDRLGNTVTSELATEVELEFAVVNTGILPVPEACNPIAVLAFVQLYVAPVTVPVSAMSVDGMPLQKSILLIGFTSGLGPTCMVKLVMLPGHCTALFV